MVYPLFDNLNILKCGVQKTISFILKDIIIQQKFTIGLWITILGVEKLKHIF